MEFLPVQLMSDWPLGEVGRASSAPAQIGVSLEQEDPWRCATTGHWTSWSRGRWNVHTAAVMPHRDIWI